MRHTPSPWERQPWERQTLARIRQGREVCRRCGTAGDLAIVVIDQGAARTLVNATILCRPCYRTWRRFPDRRWARELAPIVTEDIPSRPAGKRACPVCGRKVEFAVSGEVRAHTSKVDGAWCTGALPSAGAPT